MKYTHHNNELTIKNVNDKVLLKGWVAKVRNLGGLLFIDLRDKFGITQLIIHPTNNIYQKALEIKNEYVIEASGIVIKRSSINKNIKTGEIEVEVDMINILSKSLTPPLLIQDDTDALEEVRLKYRYLDLRRPVMQNFLIKRSNIMQSIRTTLINEGFLELETPLLGKSTPEGARDYLVPSRLYHNNFYALPQSPQLYKQLYMIAGFEKYFQFAKCFRDEDLRADRQPEFTQVDIEASFIDEEDIKSLIEKMFKKLFKDVLNKDIEIPFINMTYSDALNIYGSDKPDLRFDLKLKDYSSYFKSLNIPLFENDEVIKGILVNGNFTRKVIDSYADLVKKYKAKALGFLKYSNNEFSGSLSKFVSDNNLLNMNEGDILFLIGGSLDIVNNSLGSLRSRLGEDLNLIKEDDYKFLWVVDWPLLEYEEDDHRFYAKHHPFTSPKNIDELINNPKDALAKAYDIVLNGYEIGGGSIRIHNEDVQNLMFKTLGFDEKDIKEKFGFFVDALKYGTPPHGGIALGLDRIVMLMTNTKNIKDVIAFPKTQSAKDLMMDAPNLVDDIQIEELGLKLKK